MADYLQILRSFSPSLRRFLLASSLATTVYFGIMAVLFNLYLLRLGFDARYIGLLAGLGQVVWAAAALPAGMLSSRIGLRNSIQLALAIFGLSIALTLLVELVPEARWEAWLLGCYVVLNIGIALYTVNVPPYLMAVTGERERRHAFASLAAVLPATALIGSVIAGVVPGMLASRLGMTLEQPDPYRMTLWLGPILCWLGILPLLGADPARVAGRGGEAGHVITSSSRAPLGLLTFWGIVVFLAAVGEGAVRTFFNVFMDTALHVSPAAIGTVMGVAQILPIAVALSLPLLMARWGTSKTFIRANLAMAVCLAVLAAATGVWMAAGAYVAIIAVLTLTGTSRDMLGQELVIPRWRTSSQGVAMIGMALGWATAGIVGGTLIEAAGFGALFLAGAVAAVLATILLFGYLRRAGKAPLTQAATPPPDTVAVTAESIVIAPEPQSDVTDVTQVVQTG
jgi:MFS family permease